MQKLEAYVNPFYDRQRQTTSTTVNANNSGQSDPYVSFLLMQATQKRGNCQQRMGNIDISQQNDYVIQYQLDQAEVDTTSERDGILINCLPV